MRKLLVALASMSLLAIGVAPALAHVTVSPSSVAKGGFAKLAFSVPNEQDDASTTKVEVFVPDDVDLAFASVRPVPGWNATVEKRHLAKPVESDDGAVSDVVSKITWDGGEIKPGEFQLFEVSVGPLPETGSSIVFKAIQTYSNGDIVRWIDVTPASGEEPEHPAPTLELTAASEGGHHGDAAASEDERDDKDNSGLAVGLSVAALVVSLLGGGLALSARRSGGSVSS